MFYPIPSLGGKYEIDENGVVRNAKSKRLLATINNVSYSFFINSKKCCVSKLKLLDEVFGNADEFLPIPSLDNKYEINNRGVVRNAISKRIMTPVKSPRKRTAEICIRDVNNRSTTRSLQQLMWEVWGILPKRHSVAENAMSVQIQRYGEYRSFSSYSQCAAFLAPKLNLSHHHLRKLFTLKVSTIGEWQIFYKQPEERIIKPYRVYLARDENEN